jgi:hypothetical protein
LSWPTTLTLTGTTRRPSRTCGWFGSKALYTLTVVAGWDQRPTRPRSPGITHCWIFEASPVFIARM